MGADGDVRKKWNIVSHNLPAGPARQALDAAIAGGATKIAKLRHVEGVGLDEYPWSDEFQTTFFVSGASIFACERRPWLSDYAHPCRASLSFGQGLVATYTFSIEHLAEWKEIEAHARRVTASYLSSAPGSAR